mmetsp:Transcript_32409/g.81564  ORF Transcript_32409/g.81564 Transcript_32409/m.81564 type:complete len:204 (+) Transcript_32409:306-917(+)
MLASIRAWSTKAFAPCALESPCSAAAGSLLPMFPRKSAPHPPRVFVVGMLLPSSFSPVRASSSLLSARCSLRSNSSDACISCSNPVFVSSSPLLLSHPGSTLSSCTFSSCPLLLLPPVRSEVASRDGPHWAGAGRGLAPVLPAAEDLLVATGVRRLVRSEASMSAAAATVRSRFFPCPRPAAGGALSLLLWESPDKVAFASRR